MAFLSSKSPSPGPPGESSKWLAESHMRRLLQLLGARTSFFVTRPTGLSGYACQGKDWETALRQRAKEDGESRRSPTSAVSSAVTAAAGTSASSTAGPPGVAVSSAAASVAIAASA
jgi:hypothetical protein